MLEYLTPANVAIVVSLMMSAFAVLKVVAPKTKTTVDDDIVAFVEKARPWVRDFALPAWALVEQLQKQGKILKGGKYDEYLTVLRDAFAASFGRALPKELEVDAQLMAQGLSAAEKLQKEAVAPAQRAPAGNPMTSLDAAK